jgi:hypothetical protein
LNIKKLIKNVLFIFVVLSLGVLVYKEFSPKNESNATNGTEQKFDTAIISSKPLPAPESQPVKKPSAKQDKETTLPLPEMKPQNAKVIAYYFHGTFRCTTCQNIEKYSKEAIEHYFPNELKNGKIEFKPLNVEETENRHYIQDYQLFSRALVISLVKQDKEVTWKNLSDVWKHVRNKDKFFQYVKDEVDIFLKET